MSASLMVLEREATAITDGGPHVLVDGPDVGVFVTKSADVAFFASARQKLAGLAMDEDSSSALIKQIAAGLVDG